MAENLTLSLDPHAKGRVLLISCDRLSRRLTASVLKSEGYVVFCESSDTIRDSDLIESGTLPQHFDLVIVDEPDTVLSELDDMPELPELLADLKIDVPVIAMSVMLSQQKVLEAGYTAVIAKPLCPATLLKTASRLCAAVMAR